MKHDDLCELKATAFTPWGIRTPSCQCGSRAFPLCEGCASDQHLKHHPKAMTGDRDCACDLCVEEAAS